MFLPLFTPQSYQAPRRTAMKYIDLLLLFFYRLYFLSLQQQKSTFHKAPFAFAVTASLSKARGGAAHNALKGFAEMIIILKAYQHTDLLHGQIASALDIFYRLLHPKPG